MTNKYSNSEIFRSQIHKLIPGGAHTYSKGDDQFPFKSPAAIERGKGAYVWDVDGNQFLDCTMGLASVSLGHAYDSILDRVKKELEKGVNFQRPSYLELEMAEKFVSLIPCHDMIKFAKNGSTLTTAAVKLARAYTGRKLIAFPGDHPFYSYDDWFIGKTNVSLGVPSEIADLSITFKSCDLESLRELFEKYPNQIACVISEPEKNHCGTICNCEKGPGIFLQKAIDLCHQNGALFILDEMQSGFRTSFPGSITKYNLSPDLTTWGKGIANGFSFSALTGKKDVMELGGINKLGKEKTFLISTTHGAETHSMAACLETIRIFETENVIDHNHSIGEYFIKLANESIVKADLIDNITLLNCQWMPAFQFKNRDREISQGYRTLAMQEMIEKGFLFQGFFLPCFSHTKDHVDQFIHSFNEMLLTYKRALEDGYEKHLIGEPAKAVFRKYN
jgi:glutamate-1-semialdehyde 2,1-aminomutase